MREWGVGNGEGGMGNGEWGRGNRGCAGVICGEEGRAYQSEFSIGVVALVEVAA